MFLKVPRHPSPAAILCFLIRNAQQHPPDKDAANKVYGEKKRGGGREISEKQNKKRQTCRGIPFSLICGIH